MQNMIAYCITLCLLLLSGCTPEDPKPGGQISLPVYYTVTTDKAVYNPGDEVTISISPAVTTSLQARYKYLNEIVNEVAVSGTSWTWQPPATDFKGYLMELVDVSGDKEKIVATVSIDVSSTWTKFPRYGFVSKFPSLSNQQIEEVVANLNRHRINGIQFYDWHFKHHQPLAGTVENPTAMYHDIINREIYFSTVDRYIDEGHKYNIRSMFYNLVYGALNDAAAAGVKEEWYVYTDNTHSNKDKHPLSAPFISDIYLTDPANAEWQAYLANENAKVYAALDFDGFHMDQLGDRGSRYHYNGTSLNLANTFKPFVEAMKNADPDKAIVMNAVNQYGQQGLAQAPVDFLYTEVWSPNDTYADLAKIIKDNNAYSNNTMNTVLAAYVNYDLANNVGYFNTPSVLFTDAVIFAFGGSHLELGEHMLGKEYFPNSNLALKDDLKRKLINYYDFLVAYQNLLRDGGTFNAPSLISADNRVLYNAWPPQIGKVSVVGKEIANQQIIHLLNFTNATTMQWRDNNGSQKEPVAIESVRLRVNVTKPVKKVWYASPDFDNGASHQVEFSTAGNQISFAVPWLQYWDMIVVEYQ